MTCEENKAVDTVVRVLRSAEEKIHFSVEQGGPEIGALNDVATKIGCPRRPPPAAIGVKDAPNRNVDTSMMRHVVRSVGSCRGTRHFASASLSIFVLGSLLGSASADTTLTVDLSAPIRSVTHAASGSLYGVTETLRAARGISDGGRAASAGGAGFPPEGDPGSSPDESSSRGCSCRTAGQQRTLPDPVLFALILIGAGLRGRQRLRRRRVTNPSPRR